MNATVVDLSSWEQSLPSRAVDFQLTIARWLDTEPARRVTVSEARYAFVGDENDRGGKSERMGATVLTAYKQVTRLGEVFAVTSQLADTIAQASTSIPLYELHREDMPCPCGFIMFERVVAMGDARGNTIAVSGLGWCEMVDTSGNEGVFVVVFTDPTHPADHMNETWGAEMVPRWRQAFGALPPCLPMVVGLWGYGSDRYDGGGGAPTPWFAAFLRFIAEPWVDSAEHRVPRAAARRVERATGHVPKVRVVRLRRRAKDDDRERGDSQTTRHQPEFQYPVRGHWRNQWYPSQERHAPKWIAPYLKGPEDAPLRSVERVFVVDR